MPLLDETQGTLIILTTSFWYLAVAIVCLLMNAFSGWSFEAAESKDICHFYAYVVLDKTPFVVCLTEENTAHLTAESLGPAFQHQAFLSDNTFPMIKAYKRCGSHIQVHVHTSVQTMERKRETYLALAQRNNLILPRNLDFLEEHIFWSNILAVAFVWIPIVTQSTNKIFLKYFTPSILSISSPWFFSLFINSPWLTKYIKKCSHIHEYDYWRLTITLTLFYFPVFWPVCFGVQWFISCILKQPKNKLNFYFGEPHICSYWKLVCKSKVCKKLLLCKPHKHA